MIALASARGGFLAAEAGPFCGAIAVRYATFLILWFGLGRGMDRRERVAAVR